MKHHRTPSPADAIREAHRKHTPQSAVDEILAVGWKSDALAEDAAVRMLIEQGDQEICVRPMVRKIIKGMQPTRAN